MLSSISTKQKIVLLILLAVLLRLAIMPFFMHMDMLSEFRRINFSFENNEFYPGFNRLTVFYIEVLFYSVTHFFVVLPEVVLYLPDPAHSTATTTTHFIFAGDNYAYRHIFLFKLPYLIFDLLCGLVVWRYFEGHRLQMFALAFWLFNPVTIYATYFFGRFEVISIFFLLATALALKQEKLILASIAFGLALNCREINLIFLPAFGLLMLNGLRSNTFALKTLLLSASIIVAAVFIPYILEWFFGLTAAFTREANVLEVNKGINAFFNVKLGPIYPFFLIVALCYFLLLNKPKMRPEHLFVVASLAVILPFFIGDFRSAHYFTWTIPFILLACYHVERIVLPVLVLLGAWLLHWLFNPTGAHFTPLLATPINEAFFGYGSFSHNWNANFASTSGLSAKELKYFFLSTSVVAMVVVLFRSIRQAGQ